MATGPAATAVAISSSASAVASRRLLLRRLLLVLLLLLVVLGDLALWCSIHPSARQECGMAGGEE
jgi:hypothetical protein